MERCKIKPSDSKLVVRDPKSKKKLEADGEIKNLSSYWRRRIKDGSVVKVLKPAPVKRASTYQESSK